MISLERTDNYLHDRSARRSLELVCVCVTSSSEVLSMSSVRDWILE